MATVKLGSLRKRKDRPGTWEASYFVNGERRRASALSREELTEKLRALMEEARSESDDLAAWSRDVTLTQYADHWLDAIIENIEPSTIESYRQLLKAHIEPFKLEGAKTLGSLRLKDIRLRHVKSLIVEKRKEGYSKATVRLIRAALSSLLTDATADELIRANPALAFSGRKQKMADKKNRSEFEESIRAMDGGQLQAFINVALARNEKGDLIERQFGVFFVLLGKTGLRPSEAIALTPHDVSLQKQNVRVEKVFTSKRIRPYTKTGNPRTVDLSSDLSVTLRTHLAELRERALKKGMPMPQLLFPSAAGTHIDWNNAVDAFHRMREKAKIPHIPPYCLRHTFASLLLKVGAPITYVQAQLGHTSAATTLRFYGKHLPDDRQRFVDRLDVRDADGQVQSKASAQ
ncbi:MAG: site-specific integrase [Acidobacteria bacterium]|nr:site-specific integrase [Acidobacteriota bacterium]